MANNMSAYTFKVCKALDLPIGARKRTFVEVKIKDGNNTIKSDKTHSTKDQVYNHDVVWIPSDKNSAMDRASIMFDVTLKHRFCSKKVIGTATISFSEMNQQASEKPDGQVILDLKHPKNNSPAGHLYVCLTTQAPSTAVAKAITNIQPIVGEMGLSSGLGSVMKVGDTIVQVGSSPGVATSQHSLADIVSKLDGFVKFVDKVAAVHPYISLAWTIASAVQKVVSAQVKRDEKIVKLIDVIDNSFHYVDTLLKEAPDNNRITKLENDVKTFFVQTMECMLFIQEYSKHKFAGRLIKHMLSVDDMIKKFTDIFHDLQHKLQGDITLQVAITSFRASSNVDKLSLRQELKPLDTRSIHQECLSGTRQGLLNCIQKWFATSEQNILWLAAPAGFGKSTIANTANVLFSRAYRVAGYLAFERNKQSSLQDIIHTLVFNLACSSTFYMAEIQSIVDKGGLSSILGMTPERQFDELFLTPLKEVSNSMEQEGPLLIILDALDECESPKELANLLGKCQDLPSCIRILITSRPESVIKKELAKKIHVHILSEIESLYSSQSDIVQYLTIRFQDIKENYHNKSLLKEPWPEVSVIEELAKQSHGLFIWCKTVMNFIADGNIEENLDAIINQKAKEDAYLNLYNIYSYAFKQSGGTKWKDSRFKEDFQNIMALAILGRASFTMDSMQKFLRPYNPKTIEHFGSVVELKPIRLIHPSLADYLLNDKVDIQEPWHINAEEKHLDMAYQCLDIMKNELKFNIGGSLTSYTSNVGQRSQQEIDFVLVYSCCFWGYHLGQAKKKEDSQEIQNSIENFLTNQLLFWLEVLSVSDNFKLAKEVLAQVMGIYQNKNNHIFNLCEDAISFVTGFSVPISTSAPHVYISALPCAPSHCLITKYYGEHYHNTIDIVEGRNKYWPASINIFQGHDGHVKSVAFSPDGLKIVSGSRDRTIRVWNATTGSELHQFQGHDSGVDSVAFSPDGQKIVSGSDDRTIRVWDVTTGSELHQFQGHDNWVNSVAFSSDGQKIVSGSNDRTIRVWDVTTGSELHQFQGHDSGVDSVAFSPDGQKIVSGSNDRTIRVWDVTTGSELHQFQGHDSGVDSVAFSPDGQKIRSGSDDRTIRVWDAATDSQLHQFQSHDNQANLVAPSGQSIFSDHSTNVQNCSRAISSLLTSLQLPNAQGWVTDKDGKLLFWLPPNNRVNLCFVETGNLVISKQKTCISLVRFVHGIDWKNCLSPRPSEV